MEGIMKKMPEFFVHDSNIIISTGKSKSSTEWKMENTTWYEFVKRLSNFTRTCETVAEYSKLDKDRRDKIKDVGGFVGGSLIKNNFNRTKNNIKKRYIISLDFDGFESTEQMKESIDLLIKNNIAFAAYSTHSDKTDGDIRRIRILIPLQKAVTPDQYSKITTSFIHKYEQTFTKGSFDESSTQAERLMYWPSCSIDAQPYFDYNDAKLLDPSNYLTDISPVENENENEEIAKKEIKKLGDPKSKTGMIGYFCKTYTITAAIRKFLFNVYEPSTTKKNRYTYIPGESKDGLIIFDDYDGDSYAYSHHDTDPAKGRALNAFDLVRIHFFGDLDSNIAKTTNITKYPSYIKMMDLCEKDKNVIRTITDIKIEKAGEDFSYIDATENEDWKAKLNVNKRGDYLPNYNNIRLILENDPKLKGCFAFDEFLEKKVILKRPPWRKESDNERFIRDDDESSLRAYFGEDPWCIEATQKISDILNNVCRANAYHPVKKYLKALNWDGKRRLETLFIDYLGAEDTSINRTMTKIMFVAAVTRIYKPGTKFDQMLILVGKQGCGKSEILKRMAVNESWFTDSMPSPEDPKNASEHLLGKWIIEMGELVAWNKATAEANKSFISRTSDKFRAAYAKNETFRLRQCVFFGTTNQQEFLKDFTGERRYWPMDVSQKDINKCKSIDNDLTQSEIDQYWAEALVYYKEDMSLKLPNNLSEELKGLQLLHKEEDETQREVLKLLEMRVPEGYQDCMIDSNDQALNFLSNLFHNEFSEIKVDRETPATKLIEIVRVYDIAKIIYDETPSRSKTTKIGQILNNEGWIKMRDEKKTSYHYCNPKIFSKSKDGVTRKKDNVNDDAHLY
jgi:putative DNA primase/helicase